MKQNCFSQKLSCNINSNKNNDSNHRKNNQLSAKNT